MERPAASGNLIHPMNPPTRPVFAAVLALAVSCGGQNPVGITDVPASECPSGQKWTGGNRESDLMQPGLDCVACHTREGEGPRFSISGTVYQDFSTADACTGVSGLKVVITGADGKVLNLIANEAGNFFSEAVVALPYTARVVSANGERAMAGPQTVGSCNGCHTPTGLQSAPGRIVAP
jgi:hypothetical protein